MNIQANKKSFWVRWKDWWRIYFKAVIGVIIVIFLTIGVDIYREKQRTKCENCKKWNAYKVTNSKLKTKSSFYKNEDGERNLYYDKEIEFQYQCKFCNYKTTRIEHIEERVR